MTENLPDWIKWSNARGYYVLLDSLTCKRCGFNWYPTIATDGSLKLHICPTCKTKLWNVEKKSK